MNSAGNGEDAGDNGWWAKESALPPFHISTEISQEPAIVASNLAREDTLLAGIAENMRSGFLLLNAAEQVAYFNPSAKRLLGIGGQEPSGQVVFDVREQLVSLAADKDSARAELDRMWRCPEEEGTTELALVDAAVRWLRVHSFPVRDQPGRLMGRGVLLDDVTLERSAVQARSETLALAAHELKTPLAIVKGCATTLLGNVSRWDPAMLREMLQMIDIQADRLHDMLNTLLDVWRFDAGVQSLRFSEVKLSELLKRVVDQWRKNAPRHSFMLQMPPEDIVVRCDALRIEQAASHLLDNAVTYSQVGGMIKVQLETNDVEVRLSVSDQGIGIAAEHLERIFERFYRVTQGEQRAGGSGLGLAAARATVEAHGGRIWADSPGLGQGSTFYCSLPFAPALPAFSQQPASWSPVEDRGPVSSAPSSGPLAPLPTGPLQQGRRSRASYRVLVAESDSRIARYLRAHLEEQQYRVQVVGHGVQCLRQLDLEDPNILLLTTRLADMSGIELLRRLREFSQMPVMMLCDECDEEERVRLLDLGADDVVVKPFSIQELLARVRVLLRRQATSSEQSGGEVIFTSGDLSIDYAQHQVLLQGRPVQLSRTEYKLLSTLTQNVGRVMTHELLLERVWGAEYNREVDFIWVYISRLRRKIEADPRHPRYIVTVPDVGYKLVKL